MNAYERLSKAKRSKLASKLVSVHQESVNAFIKSLSVAVSRQIERIIVLALHGDVHESKTIDAAIKFIQSYDDDGRTKPIERYEIQVRFNNGDSINASFKDKRAAVEFLKTYQPVSPKVV